MSTQHIAMSGSRERRLPQFDDETRHRWMLAAAWIISMVFVFGLAIYGLPYYRLPLAERGQSPYHIDWRPSGSIGIRLGLLGVAMFGILFLYPIRKRWPWLSRIGKTSRWLDFHVVVGVTAPLVITLHSTLKLQGLAGLAYWIMMIVAISGFAGRYLYAQIPRSMAKADLSMQDLQAESEALAAQLAHQDVLTPADIAPMLELPTKEEVRRMNIFTVMVRAAAIDLARPMTVSRLRRRVLSGWGLVWALWGLLPSGNAHVEAVICAARRQSWLSAKMLFLSRMRELFQLWHVVHRPFSYSFVVLAFIHIAVVLLFGYH